MLKSQVSQTQNNAPWAAWDQSYLNKIESRYRVGTQWQLIDEFLAMYTMA